MKQRILKREEVVHLGLQLEGLLGVLLVETGSEGVLLVKGVLLFKRLQSLVWLVDHQLLVAVEYRYIYPFPAGDGRKLGGG
jgi:hypothetical protein